MRYEPRFLSQYVAPLYTTGKISATEAYTRSMSWGLMQVMGQTAREFGFDSPALTQLCDPTTRDRYRLPHLRREATAPKRTIPQPRYAHGTAAQTPTTPIRS